MIPLNATTSVVRQHIGHQDWAHDDQYLMATNMDNYADIPISQSGKWIFPFADVADVDTIVRAIAYTGLSDGMKVTLQPDESGRQYILVYGARSSRNELLGKLRDLGITESMVWKNDQDTIKKLYGPSSFSHIATRGQRYCVQNPNYAGQETD